MALEAAGILADTPDPVEGVIGRDPATGQPTGLLLEMAGYLRERLGNTLSPQELQWSVSHLSEKLLSYGITSVQDAGPNNGAGHWDTFRSLVSSGSLRQRTTMMAGGPKLDEFLEAGLRWSSGDDALRLGHAKIMLTLTTGILHPAPEDLEKLATTALAQGFPYAVHAVEEEALAAMLDLTQVDRRPLEEPGRERPFNSLLRVPRNRIEHCAECPPRLMEKLAQTGFSVVTQPGSIYWRGGSYVERVDPAMLPYLYCVEEFSRRGIPLAFGSDAPLIDPNPWPAIYAAVTLRTAEGAAFPRSSFQGGVPDDNVPGMDISRALKAYTSGGAKAEGAGNVKGSIKPGMLADLVLIDTPLDSNETEQLKHARARLTVVGGKVAWEDGKSW